MRERSIAAAQQPAVRQRVADALQRVLDTLIANLDAKTKTYKNKVGRRTLTQSLLLVNSRMTSFRCNVTAGSDSCCHCYRTCTCS
jgi:hypothetical protein